ncbi:MAG: polyphosphate polymerase domain-containing protein [Oscillospiraceae bacterium]|nr:polyphosphate polymerase domain-containing protein [Oscillospiraceae bacterium]
MEKNYRHEYKFLISRQASELIKRRLSHVMQRDAHAGPTGQYTIRSLYFDDLAFRAFDEKVSGIDNRTKYRIRCYNYSDGLFKLEKKEKKGHLTRKTAMKVSREDVLSMQRNPRHRVPDHPEGLTEELRLQCTNQGARPVVLVDYDRTPFVSVYGNTRITLDENLRTVPYTCDIFAPGHPATPVMEPDQVILEVKFDDFLPGHLSACLEDIPKIPMAISKFAMCLNLI